MPGARITDIFSLSATQNTVWLTLQAQWEAVKGANFAKSDSDSTKITETPAGTSGGSDPNTATPTANPNWNPPLPAGAHSIKQYAEWAGQTEFTNDPQYLGMGKATLAHQGDTLKLIGKDKGQMYRVKFQYWYDDRWIAGIDCILGVDVGRSLTIKNVENDFKELAHWINLIHKVHFLWEVWSMPGNSFDAGALDATRVQEYRMAYDKRQELLNYLDKYVADNMSGVAHFAINMAHFGEVDLEVTTSAATMTVDSWDLPHPIQDALGIDLGGFFWVIVVLVVVVVIAIVARGV